MRTVIFHLTYCHMLPDINVLNIESVQFYSKNKVDYGVTMQRWLAPLSPTSKSNARNVS